MRTTSLKTKALGALAATAMLLGLGVVGTVPQANAALGNGTDIITQADGTITISGSSTTGAVNTMNQSRQFKAYRILDYKYIDDDGVTVAYKSGTDASSVWQKAVNAGAKAANDKNSVKVTLTGTDSTISSTEKVAGSIQEVQDVLSNSGNGSRTEYGETSTNAGAAYAFANAVYKYTDGTNTFTGLTADAATGTSGTDCGSGTTGKPAVCFTWNDSDSQWKATGLQYGYYLVVEVADTDASGTPTQQKGQPSESYLMLADLKTDTATTDQNHKAPTVALEAKSQTPTSHKYISGNTSNGTATAPDGNPRATTQEADGASSAKSPDFNIGDEIEYTLQFDIPNNYLQDFYDHGAAFSFTMQDHLSAGLNYVDNSATIRVVNTDTTKGTSGVITMNSDEPTFTQPKTAEDAGFVGLDTANPAGATGTGEFLKWVFELDPAATTATSYKNMGNYMPGATVYITYKAKMNKDAVIASTGNPNEFNVSYSRSPYGTGDSSYTPTETPRVYTYGINLSKVDLNNENLTLPGAHFCLSTSDSDANCQSKPVSITEDKTNTDGAYHVIGSGETAKTETIGKVSNIPAMITDTTGGLTVKGLDAGTYYLYETQAPNGYAQLSKPVKIEITATGYDDDTANDTTDRIYYPTINSTAAYNNEDTYKIAYTKDYDSTKTQTADEQNVSYSTDQTKDAIKGYTNLPAYKITNRKRGSLPITGGQGIALAVIVGLGLVGIGAIVTKRSRKDETVEA